MKNQIWKIVKNKYKTTKNIQNFIMQGVEIAISIVALLFFLLVMTAVKRNLGI